MQDRGRECIECEGRGYFRSGTGRRYACPSCKGSGLMGASVSATDSPSDHEHRPSDDGAERHAHRPA